MGADGRSRELRAPRLSAAALTPPPGEHTRDVERREDADRALELRVDYDHVGGTVREHQFSGLAQRHRRLDADDWLQRDRASGLVRPGADSGPQQIEVGDDPPDELLSRSVVRNAHYRDTVDMVRGHQPRNVDERRIGPTREDAGVHCVGNGRVLKPRHQIAAVIGLDRGGGHCDLLVVRALT